MENFSEGAEWSTRYKNDLPDSAFLYIEAGGKKDSEGKIKPRSLRHFPYKDMDGKVDRAHILNAIARIPQAKFLSQAQKDRLQARARQIYLKFVKYNSKKANSHVELISRLAAAVDLSPTVASDTSLDVIRRTMKDIQMTGDSMAEPYLPPSNAPEWQNDLSFQMLINGIYIPPSFSSNQEKMRCLYNFFRDMVMIEPPMNQNQQGQILNLFMVWSECLGRVG